VARSHAAPQSSHPELVTFMAIRCTAEVINSDGTVWVGLGGELDNACLTVLLSLAGDLETRSRRLVLDLADVTFIDSSGVYGLVQLQQRWMALTVINPGDGIRAVLRITGLDHLIGDEPPAG
jgi:anti-anti-sigma factor